MILVLFVCQANCEGDRKTDDVVRNTVIEGLRGETIEPKFGRTATTEWARSVLIITEDVSRRSALRREMAEHDEQI